MLRQPAASRLLLPLVQTLGIALPEDFAAVAGSDTTVTLHLPPVRNSRR